MNIIKKTRKEKGINIKTMSEYLDIPFLVYLYYENNIDQMEYKFCKELCKFLELDYHQLYK